MVSKNLVALPVLFFLSACGSSSDIVQAPADLTGGAGSVTLPTGGTAVAENVTQVLAVDFDGSATGSTVTIEEFAGLSDVSMKIKEKVAGQSTVVVSGQIGDGETLSQIISSENLALLLEIQNNLQDVDSVEEEPIVNEVNGLDIVVLVQDTDLNTTSMQEGYITIETGDETVLGSFTTVEDGADSTTAFGSGRIGDVGFTAPTAGDFTYEGQTEVFTENDFFSSNASTMTVNFGNLTGTYSADTFVDGDDNAVILSVESDILLNNIDGTISGSGGSVTFEGVTGNMEVQGVMSGDNLAVAGVFVTDDATAVGGIQGGVFAGVTNP
ncbi:hypothetical protein N9P29_00300 [bacterium]|nr:hypothetical protein [bacterium]